MQYLNLYHRETNHTNNWSQVVVDNDKVYQLTNNYRDVHSQDQLSKIIENLVIDKGFIMRSQKNNTMILENPTQPEVTYRIWNNFNDLGISKETYTLVGNLDM